LDALPRVAAQELTSCPEDIMAGAPVQVIVAAFQDPAGASESLRLLKEAHREALIGISEAAVITRDEKGKVRIRETGDLRAGRGFALGAVAGGVIGLLAGPVGWAALGGGVVGGLAARLRDGGFRDDRLRQLGEALTPGSSALVAVVEHTWVAQVHAALADEAQELVVEGVSAELADRLRAGGELTLSATVDGEGIELDRVETDGDRASLTAVDVDDEATRFGRVTSGPGGVRGAAASVTARGAAAVFADAPARDPQGDPPPRAA
jgi:uncharacterized membrane protein